MLLEQADEIKHRDICFCDRHPNQQQAETATLLLQDIAGIKSASLLDNHRLQVHYNIQYMSLEIIERALTELGFHLDNSLLSKVKRALYYYTEEVQRENLGITDDQQNNTQSVFINRYQNLKHGCRDGKQEYWRKYQ